MLKVNTLYLFNHVKSKHLSTFEVTSFSHLTSSYVLYMFLWSKNEYEVRIRRKACCHVRYIA